MRVLSGASPGEPLKDLASRVAPSPLLLIAAGEGIAQERELNRILCRSGARAGELWDLPDVSHTAAIRERPAEHERRAVRFFDKALLERTNS